LKCSLPPAKPRAQLRRCEMCEGGGGERRTRRARAERDGSMGGCGEVIVGRGTRKHGGCTRGAAGQALCFDVEPLHQLCTLASEITRSSTNCTKLLIAAKNRRCSLHGSREWSPAKLCGALQPGSKWSFWRVRSCGMHAPEIGTKRISATTNNNSRFRNHTIKEIGPCTVRFTHHALLLSKASGWRSASR
jgi:hypothetical protein